MKKCVDEGNLGAKTGTGLYQWKPEDLTAIKKRREEILIEWLQKDKQGEEFQCTLGIIISYYRKNIQLIRYSL